MAAGKALTKSEDKWIGGVCGGIAEYLGWSPMNVRILYVLVSAFSAAFPGMIAYGILWMFMPSAKGGDDFRA